jgi:5,10-methylenetetrahydromethanopterin reductase
VVLGLTDDEESTQMRSEAKLAVMLPVTADARALLDLARRAEAAGVDEAWIAEDLGLHGGVALSAAVLSATRSANIGLGIAPASARNPAFLAMQAATLAQLHPGRFRLGIGHGMPEWMRAVGAWPGSPLARLEETFVAVRRLLAGERVTFVGREVQLEDVVLAHAPVDVPLFAGVRGPRSLEVAGRVADGLILAGWAGPAYIEQARAVAEAAGGRPLTVVASARFALDEAEMGSRAVDRLAADLERAGDVREAMQLGGDDRSDDRITSFGIAGDAAELQAGIARWAAAGADVVLLDPLTPQDLEVALGIVAR